MSRSPVAPLGLFPRRLDFPFRPQHNEISSDPHRTVAFLSLEYIATAFVYGTTDRTTTAGSTNKPEDALCC